MGRWSRSSDWNQQNLWQKKSPFGEMLNCTSSLALNLLMAVFVTGFSLVTIASAHQISTLEIPVSGDTIPKTLTFPLYEQQGIRYFSAGIGKEERVLQYPPYALKLIFVKGERAFLAGISLEIQSQDGNILASIPAEEVQGPWLFIDLSTGKYLIKATSSAGKTINKTVEITGKTSTVIHFRWP